MARRPDPLETVLPQAEHVVVAEVIEVVSTGEAPPPPDSPYVGDPHAASVGYLSAEQEVRLRVDRVLRGDLGAEVVVRKPRAPYTLGPGDHGPFLIADGVILGAYGPDTYRLEAIQIAVDSL